MTAIPDAPRGGGPRVGLLFDSVSENTGDAAIGIAVRQELARYGIDDTVVVDPFTADAAALDAVVVGGGELIRPRGDAFYDTFRLAGGTVLNAVGVWEEADDLGYLSSYDLVSARSSVEAERLSRYVGGVRVLPCTTTTLESERFEVPGLQAGEPVVGIHVVPHTLAICPDIVDIVNAIPYRKVLIPFTHYNFDDSFMRALPFDPEGLIRLPRLRPLELHSVIGQMSSVVVSSLHASLFAYAQGVPFASAYQEKVRNYFADRGAADLVFRDGPELRSVLERIEAGEVDLSGRVAVDRAAVGTAFADVADLVRARAGAEPRSRRNVAHRESDQAAVNELVLAQRATIIVDRDAVISGLLRRAICAEGDVERWHAEADRLANARSDAVARRDQAIAERDVLRDHVRALRNRAVAARVRRLLTRLRAGWRRRRSVSGP